MLGNGRKRTAESATTAAVLKYDQTGEPLQQQEQATDDDTANGVDAEVTEDAACSVLTPEQIYSQLSMVLRHPSGPENTSEREPDRKKQQQTATAGDSGATTGYRKQAGRAKRARERKARKTEQPKRAKLAETRPEKRPRRRPKQQTSRPSTAPQQPLPLASSSANEASIAPSLPLATIPTQPCIHVVEISPENSSSLLPLLRRRRHVCSDHPPTLVSKATPPSPAPSVTKETPGDSQAVDTMGTEGADPAVSTASMAPTNKPEEKVSIKLSLPSNDRSSFTKTSSKSLRSVTMATARCRCHDNPRRPPDYELLGRLIGEPILTSFYLSCHAHRLSEHLAVRFLDPLSEGSNICDPHSLPCWLEVTRKKVHIDPNLGPLPLARVLVSNSGIVKFQHLFPLIRTAFVQHVKGCDINSLLSQLSPDHVLCPGLPGYPNNNGILGYHPSGVRILHPNSVECRRYDHHECPLLHIPRSNDKKTFAENMCSKCAKLHSHIRILVRDSVGENSGTHSDQSLCDGVQCATGDGVQCATGDGVQCVAGDGVQCATGDGVQCATGDGVQCVASGVESSPALETAPTDDHSSIPGIHCSNLNLLQVEISVHKVHSHYAGSYVHTSTHRVSCYV